MRKTLEHFHFFSQRCWIFMQIHHVFRLCCCCSSSSSFRCDDCWCLLIYYIYLICWQSNNNKTKHFFSFFVTSCVDEFHVRIPHCGHKAKQISSHSKPKAKRRNKTKFAQNEVHKSNININIHRTIAGSVRSSSFSLLPTTRLTRLTPTNDDANATAYMYFPSSTLSTRTTNK